MRTKLKKIVILFLVLLLCQTGFGQQENFETIINKIVPDEINTAEDIYYFFTKYIEKKKESNRTPKQVSDEIFLADYILKQHPNLENGAYILMQSSCEEVEQNLQNNIWSFEDSHKNIALLKERNYTVKVPVSSIHKVVHHVKDGNWSYLKRRFKTKILMGIFHLEDTHIVLLPFLSIFILIYLTTIKFYIRK